MKNLLFASLSLAVLIIFAGCNSLSTEQEKLFFETSDFGEPIFISIPGEGSKKRYDEIKANPKIVDRSFIPGVSYTVKDRTKDFNPKLMAFLKKEGYLSVEQLSQATTNRYGTNTKQHEFIFYTPKMEAQLVEKKDGFTGKKQRLMLAGKRILNAVDYTNKREENGRETLSITFSYHIVSVIQEIPDPSAIFEGEARAYLNPDNGNWQLANIKLKDNGYREIQNLMNP